MKSGEVTRDLPLCACGEHPVLIWHCIKGRANVINYLVKCEYCRKKTRSRKHGADAVKEWEKIIMKQTNYEYSKTLEEPRRCEFFYKAWQEFNHPCAGSIYNGARELFADWLASPRIEPIVLTAEERKAAELAIAIGLPWIKRTDNFVFLMEGIGDYGRYKSVSADQVPAFEPLRFMLAIENGAEPIDLRTLL